MAEGVRFELTRPFGLPVFKTGAINRSATPPEKLWPASLTPDRGQRPRLQSHAFPIRTVPAQKFFQPINVVAVKIDKRLPFHGGHSPSVRCRVVFAVVDLLQRVQSEKFTRRIERGTRVTPEVFELDDLNLFARKKSKYSLDLFGIKTSIDI